MSQIELIRKHQVHAIKRFGQNFLIDGNIQRKILKALPLNQGKLFLEIGPGLGALTQHLLKQGEQVVAVEVDKKLNAILNEELGTQYSSNFQLINEDILKVLTAEKLNSLLPFPAVLVGNLPYSISSPILFQTLENVQYFESAFFTLQKEVVDRLIARPGTADYGRLTVGVGLFAKVEKHFDIAPSCFSPKPEVRSSFFSIQFKNTNMTPNERNGVLELVKVSFSQRRKQLCGLLAHHYHLKQDKLDDMLIRLKLSSRVRAEDLPPQTFLNLYEMINR